MPVVLNAPRSSLGLLSSRSQRSHVLRIGLVNNMPDAALARTERQFIDLLDAATPDQVVYLSFYSVSAVVRGELGRGHLARHGYRSTAEIAAADLDALIVTGTEPKQPRLHDEPYWSALAALFDWIEREGPSAVFSCLAAHAAVLHFDGIERQRLAEKRCGLFEHAVTRPHPLTAGLPATVRVAHSRWNEVRREALEGQGYDILTAAPDAGVDLFVKQRSNPLLFFQGHPEYDSGTLFREYRRDTQRFLSGENNSYPGLPHSYFSEAEIALLNAFRVRALAERSEALIAEFPLTQRVAGNDESGSPMAAVFRNWLSRIADAKGVLPTFGRPVQRLAGMHS